MPIAVATIAALGRKRQTKDYRTLRDTLRGLMKRSERTRESAALSTAALARALLDSWTTILPVYPFHRKVLEIAAHRLTHRRKEPLFTKPTENAESF